MDNDYPKTLYNCPDAPCVLFYKGKFDLINRTKISIIGTRRATSYGLNMCEKIVSQLKETKMNPVIISGLAYGIDICAHKHALENKLDTVAVLGHGLNTIYPAAHKSYAKRIVENGCLLSEFSISNSFDSHNFVKRNRIIAGIPDAVIVIESARKGGSLITANIANTYSKDVFAFPGRSFDKCSAGCNFLIKTNQAHLIEDIADLKYIMGWNEKGIEEFVQPKLFDDFTIEEKKIIDIIKAKEKISIDILCSITKFSLNKLSSILLKLEFEGIIYSHPGKIYSLKT
jgi:DNA processing protein